MTLQATAALPRAKPTPTERPQALSFGDVLAMARAAHSVAEYVPQVLQRIGVEFHSPCAMIYARTGSTVIEEEHHRGRSDPRFWRPALQQFLTDSLAHGEPRAKLLTARTARLRIALLSAPLVDEHTGLSGAIALVMRADERRAAQALQRLETLAAVAAAAATTVGRPAASPRTELPSQALARAATMGSVEELAFALTNNLRNKYGCEQVALGLVTNQRIRLVSLSGYDDVPRRSPGVRHVVAAMEECLDAGEVLVAAAAGEWSQSGPGHGHRLHCQWQATVGRATVASLPLRAGERVVAVLSLRHQDAEALKPEALAEIEKLVAPFAPALLLLQQARRGWWQHGRELFGGAARAALRPGCWGRKAAALAFLAGLGWFLFGTLPYSVIVPATIVPTQQRHIAAPFDGVLGMAAIAVGDRVQAGQLLGRFDVRDLELERARWAAQRTIYAQEQLRALAAGARAEARLAEAQWTLAQAELDIVEQRIVQAELRAPFDGIVMRGDLRPLGGNVIARGTVLLEIAPLTDWTLELRSPEARVLDLAAGQRGTFVTRARPDQPESFTLRRIAGRPMIGDQANVQIAEAELHDAARWLRPGLEGTARIEVGHRPVWWVALHRGIEWLRLSYWL